MAVNPHWGELLVGAYHQCVTGCEVVSYNNRSDEQGEQMEADVIGIKTNQQTGEQTVYVCEVVTHMDGDLYSGTPEGDEWAAHADNDDYQFSLEKLWTKFTNDRRYVTETFTRDGQYVFQLWAPVVKGWQRGGDLIDGLDALQSKFEDETGEHLELIINQDYTAHIDELRAEAEGDTSDYGSPAFRFLQILENLK
ncbi:hypothetical protein [Halobacteriaceae bacterium SHR40]|uniref:hypothetical protein n=1 Tax=Halovenus amylolytica TaxID=2500550 RepID=UPI000FE35C7D